MVNGCPSLIQVTLVAGEPVEIQAKVEDVGSWVNPRWVMLGGAGKTLCAKLGLHYTAV